MKKSSEDAAQRIFDRVLKEIKPSKEEIQDTTYRVNKLMNLLGKIVPKSVEILVAGSIARGTNLKGDADIDIFMLFNKGIERDKLVKLGLEYGRAAARKAKGTYEMKYAEHPYIRLFIDEVGLKADIVPASKIDDPEHMTTAVDRTPLHTEFINSNFTNRQRDEVRLLKYLMKAHKIYGAEVKTGGFSGYMCELFIHHYGSLTKALEAISKFELPLIIDPRFKKEIKDAEMTKRFNSDFVVIDPVDKNRNAAAGVSHESLSRLVIVARQFSQKPEVDLFYGPGFSSLKVGGLLSKFVKDSGLHTFIIESTLPDKSEDITFPQLRKISRQIEDYLQRKGFTIYLNIPLIKGRKAVMLLLAPEQNLASRLLKGPNVFVQNAANKFMDTHKDALGFTISDVTIFAIDKSVHPKIEDALRDMPKIMKVHKDIDLRKAKIIVNKIPKELEFDVYAELLKKTTI